MDFINLKGNVAFAIAIVQTPLEEQVLHRRVEETSADLKFELSRTN